MIRFSGEIGVSQISHIDKFFHIISSSYQCHLTEVYSASPLMITGLHQGRGIGTAVGSTICMH